jgi:glycosyltransferase involved in cell wall biosynthesis
METLVSGKRLRNLRLRVAGSGSADYQNSLQSLVARAGLDDYVSFLGHVPPEEMPRLLNQSDVLLLPSTWEEPFSRMLLEGMISGLAIVATPTGGTTEILRDGENGLLFAPGEAEDLAQKIAWLQHHPELRQELAEAGKQTVLKRYTVTRMLDEVESFLQEVACGPVRERSNSLIEGQSVVS